MPKQPSNDGWTPVEDSSSGASGGWTPVEASKPTTPGLTSLETKKKSYGERHPYQREAVLGAFSGVGIPETKTPVRDLTKGTLKTLSPLPTSKEELAVEAIAPGYGLPVYRMSKGLTQQTEGFGKDIYSGLKDKDYPQAVHGAAGLTTEILSLLWGGKKGEVSSEASSNRLSAATGAYPEDIHMAKGDLESAAVKVGKPKDAAALRDLTRTALDTNTSEFSTGLQKIASKQVLTNPIADAIRAKIKPEMSRTPSGRALAKELRKAASDYDSPWTARDLYEHKQRIDTDLSAYYKKSETGKTSALKSDADVIVAQAVSDGAKDILYPEMDKANGKAPGYYRDLQRRQSALLKVKDAANTTVKELGKKEAMTKGLPLRSKIMQRLSGYIHPISGKGGVSLHRLTEPIALSDLGNADYSARSAFRRHPIEDVNNYIRSLTPNRPGLIRKPLLAVDAARVIRRTNAGQKKQLQPLE